jgi:hypothetical protein
MARQLKTTALVSFTLAPADGDCIDGFLEMSISNVAVTPEMVRERYQDSPV